MMPLPLVSVIIPNYNHAAYIRQRIDSVLAQTYPAFEVILLDDCSTDNSREIIEAYRGHPKVAHIVFNETNSGSVFRQWKKGVTLARGKYVWIAESDDYAEPELIETLIRPLEEHPELGLAYGDSRIAYDDGSTAPETYASLRQSWVHKDKWSHDYREHGRKEIAENLLDYCTINNASVVLFRKEALLRIDPFDLDLRYTGDWYIYLKLCRQYDLCYINRVLSNYREHAANSFKKSRNGVAFVREYFLVFDWIYRNLDFIPRRKIIRLFLGHTRHSLIRPWSGERIRLYKDLMKRNKVLFGEMIRHNAAEPFRSRR